jgi:hypothetical protein
MPLFKVTYAENFPGHLGQEDIDHLLGHYGGLGEEGLSPGESAHTSMAT